MTLSPPVTSLWECNADALTAFHQAVDTLGIPWNKAMAETLDRYYQALMTTNATHNLIRCPSPEAFLERHLLDSLAGAAFIPDQGQGMDLGSGGGLPLFPLAVVRPETTWVGVESTGKKATFLSQTVDALGLAKRITILTDRCETLGLQPQWRNSQDWVTSRALAPLPVLLEYALPFLKEGGTLWAWKGGKAQEELKAARKALHVLGGEVQEVISVGQELPMLGEATLIAIDKVRPTPKGYPRTVGLPSKKPL